VNVFDFFMRKKFITGVQSEFVVPLKAFHTSHPSRNLVLILITHAGSTSFIGINLFF